jgi:Uma2 family endonuclease
MAVLAKPITAEELEQRPQSDAHVELVKGEVITVPPAGHEHGKFAALIIIRLGEFVLKHKLGNLYSSETGFILSRDPDTVRAPDAAFVSNERVAQQRRKEGFFEGAPDLAIEVISPSDLEEDVAAKVLDYLQAGTRLVWLIRPRTRTVTVYRSLASIRLLTEADRLEGEEVLPGFAITVREIFQS